MARSFRRLKGKNKGSFGSSIRKRKINRKAKGLLWKILIKIRGSIAKTMESPAGILKLGKSLLVPSVQELQHLTKVPARYVQPEQQESPIFDSDGTSEEAVPTLPVIDLQKVLSGDHNSISELQNLHSTCQQWGFFQVINHEVPSTLLEDLKREVTELFGLPMEEKKKLWQQEDNFEGFGQAFVVSEEQKLDWSDMFVIFTLPHRIRSSMFYKLPCKLREVVEAYSKEMKRLSITILHQMGNALRMKKNEIAELFSDGMQSIRVNYYPPCPEPDKAIGISPHSDADALTILFQLNEIGGLQVRKDGIWVPIKPLPNALIVNIGDMMEIVSNGVYKSIEHRAVVNSNRERLSVATFYTANLDSELGPANSLTGSNNPAIFRRVPVEKYLKDFFSRKLEGKSYVDFMKVEPKGK